MTNTKTAPKSIETATAEAVALADSLATAEAALAGRKAQLAAAEARFEEIDEAFEAGNDETYSVEDFVTAEDAVTVAEKLLKATEKRVNSLRRRRVNTDLRAAEALVPLVEQALKGRVPVRARVGKPPRLSETDLDIPAVVLTQSEPSVEDGGLLATPTKSGGVILTYLRDNLLAPFPADELERLARDAGFRIEVTKQIKGAGTTGGVEVLDQAIVRVGRVAPVLPVLAAEPDADDARYWAQGVSGALVSAVARTDKPIVYMGQKTDNASGRVLSAEVVDTQIDAGTRTTIIKASMRVRPFLTDGRGVRSTLELGIDKFVGMSERGLGRCILINREIEVMARDDSGMPQPTDPRKIELTATFVSAVA